MEEEIEETEEEKRERFERIKKVLESKKVCIEGVIHAIPIEEIPEEYWKLRTKLWKKDLAKVGIIFPEPKKMKSPKSVEFVYRDKTTSGILDICPDLTKELKKDIEKGKVIDFVSVIYESGYSYPFSFGDFIKYLHNCVDPCKEEEK